MSQKNEMNTDFDQKMMQRCLALAKKASGFTAPNPMVGAVIVKDGQIISEGYHHYFGGPHAEVEAIKNAQEDLKGAHIYVNLEPCSYYGKTPPCSLAIIQHGFAKVFIATLDPNPQIAGQGAESIRKAGIAVEIGLLEDEALKLNERFFHFITHKTPFVALKTATSLDGKIATSTGESQWITNEESRDFVHTLRQDYSAILIGSQTALKDNPSLTVRKLKQASQLAHITPNSTSPKHPIRIIIDTHLKISIDFKVFEDNAGVIIACSQTASPGKIIELEAKEHITVLKCPLKDSRIDLEYVFYKLGETGIDSVLIEGGGEINFNILQNKLAHKIYAFIAPIIIGGNNSKSAFAGEGFQKLADSPRLKTISYKNFNNDILMEGYF
ncbi:MAG: bifunctional diaminohydroxyphosphoribosylaminopyrimidine deaminase/5-amino-6-(5-phosphoribosylamino)uracil reductase RibD [Bacteroidales bacterium]|nr:bifunctional diaminohydroxyphosphoribosylaminopyrimidine deaminase/5-amino-6-(5-phosphoribosylamino)uracil reductase RibD [Bacteroidales bacterium]